MNARIPLRILLVEDSADDARFLFHELTRANFDVTHQRVETAPALIDALQSASWDFVISDQSLPRLSGLAALYIVREHDPDLPFVLVSGTISEEAAVEVMKAGAQDYLLKDNLRRLAPVVYRELREAEIRRQRKAAEAALRASEQRFRALLENSYDGIVLLNAEGEVLYASPAIMPILGYGETELRGSQALELVHPDDLSGIAATLMELVQTPGARRLVRYRARHKHGHWCWVEGTATNLLHEPAVEALVLNYRDVSDQVQARNELERRVAARTAALNQAKNHVEAILDNSSEAIALTSLDGAIRRANPAFRRLFGLPDQGEVAASLLSLIEPESLARLRPRLAEVARARAPLRIELVCRRPDASLFNADVGIAPVREYTGHEPGLIFSLRDITIRKEAEENLRAALEKERQVSELRTRFASMVSHEFRTPLAIIQSASDLLKHYGDRLSDERKQDQLDEINTQVRQLTGLLEDILTINRAESYRLALQPEPLDLRDLLGDLLREARLTAAEHHFDLTVTGEPVSTVLDAALLRRALGNLLSNAVKYSPDAGSIRVTLHYRRDTVAITIADQGIGIPREDQARLFDPFHRASNVGRVSGSGLGLAIVKQAVEAHGGSISIESAEGRGSAFTVVLPARISMKTHEPDA